MFAQFPIILSTCGCERILGVVWDGLSIRREAARRRPTVELERGGRRRAGEGRPGLRREGLLDNGGPKTREAAAERPEACRPVLNIRNAGAVRV